MMVLIDSSSWIESLRQSGRVDVRTRVHDLMIAGSNFGTAHGAHGKRRPFSI
jgi:hypothetical protein